MTVILIMLILVGSVVVGLIHGTVQYFKQPKPPAGLTLEEYRQYYSDMLWQQELEKHNKRKSRE